MKFSEAFSFLTILRESTKILSKNRKFSSTILLLSLILPSILLLSLISFYRSLLDGSDLYLFFVVEIVFLLVFVAVSHVLGIATVLVSSASYTDRDLSWEQLFTDVKRTWKMPIFASFRFSSHSTRYLTFVLVVVFLAAASPVNVFTVFCAVVIGIGIIGFQLHESVVRVLVYVVSVLEEGFPGEAVERAGNLVKGHQWKGFAINVLLNLIFVVVFGSVLVVEYIGYGMGYTACGLWFVNLFSTFKMIVFMVYTVFYFQCKKECGEDVNLYGNVEYTRLSSAIVGNDIP
ncbi:Unknown protein [Striga hermonthica]|uniref:Uncharacterized protein n=1 Tax=Striga hermonthica TaxID=68872 RepID=A0A9N7NW23_STRHE|nr:Unknown protein [Striga hermonthica]